MMKLIAAAVCIFALTACQLTTGGIEYKDNERDLKTGPITISEESK
jgi:hypothetical protein